MGYVQYNFLTTHNIADERTKNQAQIQNRSWKSK